VVDLPAGVAPLDDFDPRRIGPYALLGRLGHGGMGSVYLGLRDDEPASANGGKFLAIKVIRGDLAQVPEFRARFEREARAAQRVHHAFTAAVVDVNTTGSRPYLVTSYIEGPTLAAQVQGNGPLPAANLEWLAGAIAGALRAIHAAGVVHRDLKPANILLSPFGARVIDFGIARALDATTMATEGAIGTPAFMAPEQVLNQEVTAAADIHAWGAVLVFAATGRAPFAGDTVHTIMRQVVEETPDLSGLPDSLRPLAARALVKDAAQRPTAAQLVDALQQLHAPPAQAPEGRLAAGAVSAPLVPPQGTQSAQPPATAWTPPPATVWTSPSGAAWSPPPGAAWTSPSAPHPYSGGPGDAAPNHAAAMPRAAHDQLASPTRTPGGRTARRRGLVAAIAAAVAVVLATVVTTVILTSGGGTGGDAPPASQSPTIAWSQGGVPSPTGSGQVTAAPTELATITAATPLGEPLDGPTDAVTSAAFSPDSGILAFGSDDATVRLWDVSNPARRALLGQPIAGPAGSVVSSVAFSPDGRTIAVGGGDRYHSLSGAGTVRLWDVSSPTAPKPLGQLPMGTAGSVWSVAFSHDGRTLAAGSDDSTVRLFDVSDPANARQIQQLQTNIKADVESVVFSPDGRTLAAAIAITAQLWDVSNMASPKRLGEVSASGAGGAQGVAFSPDSRTLAMAWGDGAVRMWNVADPASPSPAGRPLAIPNASATSVAFSPDGRALAAATVGAGAHLWDISDTGNPKPIGLPAGAAARLSTVVFSPDRRTLAAASYDNVVQLWKLS
jgi:WD40 repeat protein/serine/threonine protein kinase